MIATALSQRGFVGLVAQQLHSKTQSQCIAAAGSGDDFTNDNTPAEAFP